MSELVGRDPELKQIDELLVRAGHGLVVLRVEGDPGIGKSALLDAARSRGARAGFLVLECAPVASEAKLAFSSLTDLIGPIVDASANALPEPQRVAIEVALLRRSAERARVAPRAASAATVSILAGVAETQPILLVIDDAQWLDAASAETLAFAIRRLGGARIAVILAQRPVEDGRAAPLADLDSLGPDRVETSRLRPLSLSATYHILRDRGLAPESRPMLRRIHEAAAGSPLLAIELARSLGELRHGADPRAPLPVPESIRALLGRRVARLGPDARTALLVVAYAGAPTDATLRGVLPAAAAHIESLITAGVLQRVDGVLRFTHPLFADAAVSSFGPAERREMHRRLAEIDSEPERRARHRALGADGPDPEVARELDAAAVAAGRTSAEAASELVELAIGATPVEDEPARHARQVVLAGLRMRAGDTRGAIAILDEVLAHAEPGPTRARALDEHAQIGWVSGNVAVAIDRCEEALGYANLDPWTRARVSVTRSRLAMAPPEARRLALVALDLVGKLANPDLALRGDALTALLLAQAAIGEELDTRLVDEAHYLEVTAPPAKVADRFSAGFGALLKYRGAFEEARTLLRRTWEAAVAEGDEASLPYALSHLPQLELWTGDWKAAHAAAREHLLVAEWTEQEEQRLTAHFSIALVDAHAGRLDDARRRITEQLPAAEALDEWNVYQLLSVLGFVELSAGRLADGLPPLRRAYEIYERHGVGDTVAVHEDLAEALVEAGDLDAAEAVIGPYVERAVRLGRPMGLGAAHRALALLHAAHRRFDVALDAAHAALGQQESAGLPFARARTLMALGQIHRRAGNRRAARQALEEASDAFSTLGALTWEVRAHEELARLPVRRTSAAHGLTPAEERVAELVGRGRTNREVAAELFVTSKTVEANLTRIYAKLGIRSRAELAATRRSTWGQSTEL